MSEQLFKDGMEVIFQDFNDLQARTRQEIYDRVVYEIIQRTDDAVFGDSFSVNFSSANSISVLPGVGFQQDLTLDPEQATKRLLYRGSSTPLSIQAPDTVNDRIDIVTLKWAKVDGDTESRKFKNATTGVITAESTVVSQEWEAVLEIVAGTPAGSPTVPATPAGTIKIAELAVAAVAGMTDQSSITDTRDLMPLGALATINSSAFVALTQNPAFPMQTALAEIDALLKNGVMTTNIFDDVDSAGAGSVPAAPAVFGQRVLFNDGGILFLRESGPEGGGLVPVGSGGGGGGAGANWAGDALEVEEFGQKVFRYTQGDSQTLTLYVKVPNGYLAGREINARLGVYSPGTTDNFRMQITTSLSRTGQDAINASANQNVANSGDILNDNANEYSEILISLTSALGQINGFSVSPGDIIRLELTRIAPVGSEDTEDVRFIPSATEVQFG